MNLPTNVTRGFYQFCEPFKLVHDSSKLTQFIVWHTSISWLWTFTFNNFINLPNQYHKHSHTLWFLYFQLLSFLPPHFTFFACHSSLVPLYYVFTWGPLALMSFFLLVFHYNTSKLKASNANSSLVFEYCTLKQATQTQFSWSAQSRGFESAVWLWI